MFASPMLGADASSSSSSMLASSTMADTEVEMDAHDTHNVFMAPSVRKSDLLAGKSYSHFSPIPTQISEDMTTECVLGVDEAGRGPVLGRRTLWLWGPS
jgi:hypothetical protein